MKAQVAVEKKPVATADEFTVALRGLGAREWTTIASEAKIALADLYEWDCAWEAVGLAMYSERGYEAAEIAAAAGQNLRTRAVASAAAVALVARNSLTERQFRTLYAPFAAVLPLAVESSPVITLRGGFLSCVSRHLARKREGVETLGA